MVILGLLLLAAAVVFGLDELVANNPVGLPDPQVFSQSLGVTSGRGLFLIGVATGAGVVLGLWLLLAGLRHKATKASSRRQKRKALEEEARDRDALAEENAALRHRLEEKEDERRRAVAAEGSAVGAGREAVPVDARTPAGEPTVAGGGPIAERRTIADEGTGVMERQGIDERPGAAGGAVEESMAEGRPVAAGHHRWWGRNTPE